MIRDGLILMIRHMHAITTKEELFWIDFSGEIPRVGDDISIAIVGKDYEIKKEYLEEQWTVEKVLWFFSKWRDEPFPSENLNTTMHSQARVYVVRRD